MVGRWCADLANNLRDHSTPQTIANFIRADAATYRAGKNLTANTPLLSRERTRGHWHRQTEHTAHCFWKKTKLQKQKNNRA
jgi:hypothetical protein